ncbi:MAG: hypothetical protein FWG25_02270 [Promicromonosporaceae bacterium]|nr:hypothetical protein [Promicromonosporaceae bacterium]
MMAPHPTDYLVTQALIALDGLLPNDQSQIDLYVVGGYALQLASVRVNPAEATDVDYIGRALDPEVRELVNRIGLQFGLGRGWINNDLLLNGNESIADLEELVGPLAFNEVKIPELTHFRIWIADRVSLLRMKVQTLDTTLIAILGTEPLGGYGRLQDLPDIKSLITDLGYSEAEIRALVTEMASGGFLLAPEETLAATIAFLETEDHATAYQAAQVSSHG